MNLIFIFTLFCGASKGFMKVFYEGNFNYLRNLIYVKVLVARRICMKLERSTL